MMSKTHLAVGVGSALIATMPVGLKLCFISVIGGAIGGVIPDSDILDNDCNSKALLKQVAAGSMFTTCVLLADKFLNVGICSEVFLRNHTNLVFGLILFFLLYIFGILQEHRRFTHSFLAIALYSFAISCIYPPLTIPFMVGYFSHIVLDLFNKKKVQLFYPFKSGFCFGICYANKIMNKVLMYLGVVVSFVMILYGLIPNFNQIFSIF